MLPDIGALMLDDGVESPLEHIALGWLHAWALAVEYPRAQPAEWRCVAFGCALE
jgi:hypothetical protein